MSAFANLIALHTLRCHCLNTIKGKTTTLEYVGEKSVQHWKSYEMTMTTEKEMGSSSYVCDEPVALSHTTDTSIVGSLWIVHTYVYHILVSTLKNNKATPQVCNTWTDEHDDNDDATLVTLHTNTHNWIFISSHLYCRYMYVRTCVCVVIITIVMHCLK